MRHLNQNTRSVTSERITTTGTAVSKIYKNLYAFTHNTVRTVAIEITDRSDATRVVLKGRRIKAFPNIG